MANRYEDAVVEMLLNNPFKWYTGYKNVCFEFVRQKGINYKNGGHGVVDLYVHVRRPQIQYFGTGNDYYFEIKSGVSDLNSGKGLNLYGMYNYLVYPRSMITTLPGVLTYDIVERKLKEIGCEHAGIIGVLSDNDFVVERIARRYNGDGIPQTIKPYIHKNRRV